jgi:antirestriction protein ArdC
MKSQFDLYESITAEIIDAIEKGSGKFEMPWNTLSLLPSNATNHRPYRGINILLLWASARKRTYATQLWATYRQWQELGAQVRQGEKSTTVVFWKFYEDDNETESLEDNPCNGARARCFARTHHVFNADQVNGFDIPEQPALRDGERIQFAEEFFRNVDVPILERGMRASYNPTTDEIHMPPFSLFKNADYFYSTLGHEVIHSSGHPSRCNRKLGNRFGSELYAAEELIAELGSAFLAAELHLATEPRMDNAPYIDNWLKVLKSDKRAIFTAASKAQEAVDWLISRQRRSATVDGTTSQSLHILPRARAAAASPGTPTTRSLCRHPYL